MELNRETTINKDFAILYNKALEENDLQTINGVIFVISQLIKKIISVNPLFKYYRERDEIIHIAQAEVLKVLGKKDVDSYKKNMVYSYLYATIQNTILGHIQKEYNNTHDEIFDEKEVYEDRSLDIDRFEELLKQKTNNKEISDKVITFLRINGNINKQILKNYLINFFSRKEVTEYFRDLNNL